MLTFFIIVCVVTVACSSIFSLIEATLYAVPYPYVRHLAEEGIPSGKVLVRLKEDISRPISAILILNTVTNTVGAAVGGWAAVELYDERALLVFSVVFTLLILFFGEIIPKFVAVVHCRTIARVVAYPLLFFVKILSPLIFITQLIARRIGSRTGREKTFEEEIISMASIGRAEGLIGAFEGSVIENILELDQILVREILTPRIVVFRAPVTKTVAEVENDLPQWGFTRVPLHPVDSPDRLTSYVVQRDIYRELLAGRRDTTLEQLARPLVTVPDLMSTERLMQFMFEKRENICAVVDEHGALAGIVTLEDVIEEVIGREIVGEYDPVSDMRGLAQKNLAQRKRTASGSELKKARK